MASRGVGFLAGLILGGVIGAAAAIVIVPELDEETRKRLQDKSARWRVRAQEWAGLAGNEAPNLLDRGRTLLEEQRTRLREAIAEGRAAAAAKQRELRDKLERAQREGEAPL